MMERLVTRYPNLLFENCAGGGGRFDAGMLYYSPQIWCSDNTDAIDRLKIQYGTSFGYPVSAMGAHVSVCPNHQTGRTTPFETRAVVASAGTFGFELDLEHLTPEEKEMAKKQILEYKQMEHLYRPEIITVCQIRSTMTIMCSGSLYPKIKKRRLSMACSCATNQIRIFI